MANGVRRLVRLIPCRFIVHDDLDAAFFCGRRDGPRLPHVHGQGLFEHDIDAMRGARFRDCAMVVRAGKNRRGLGVGPGQQRVEGRVEEIAAQIEEPAVSRRHFAVRFHNADELNVLARARALNKIPHGIMGQTDDHEPDGRLGVLGPDAGGGQAKKKRDHQCFHNQSCVDTQAC